MTAIERSTGHVIEGGMGLVAGGGVTGATRDLDATVQHAAELLGEAFGLDVQIRFNSDRRSGGAWLKHETGHWLTSNSQVSISASVVTAEHNERMRRKYDGVEYMQGFMERLREPGVYVDLGVAAAVLKEGADMTGWREAKGLDNEPKYWGSAETVEQALAMLVERVDPAKLG